MGTPRHAKYLALVPHVVQSNFGVVTEVVLVLGDNRIELTWNSVLRISQEVAIACPNEVARLSRCEQRRDLRPVLWLRRKCVENHLDVRILFHELRHQSRLPLGIATLTEVGVDLDLLGRRCSGRRSSWRLCRGCGCSRCSGTGGWRLRRLSCRLGFLAATSSEHT